MAGLGSAANADQAPTSMLRSSTNGHRHHSATFQGCAMTFVTVLVAIIMTCGIMALLLTHDRTIDFGRYRDARDGRLDLGDLKEWEQISFMEACVAFRDFDNLERMLRVRGEMQ